MRLWGLPPDPFRLDGDHEETWLEIELEGERLVRAVIDQEEAAQAKARIMEKLTRLRSGDYLKDEGQTGDK